jgi:sugar phosphate isomerase/epimerase
MTRRQFIGSALISTMSTVLSRANEPPRWQIGCYTRPRAQYDYRVALDGIAAASCDYAAPKGVGLSIKPHGGNNANGVQCRKIIDQIDHKTFRFWYDSGNIFYYSDGKLDPVDDAATVNGVVVGMSVKDFRSPKEVELTPGTGKVDFAKVLSRLQQGGFTRGPLVVECLDPGDVAHVNAEAVKARQFLEALTGQKA